MSSGVPGKVLAAPLASSTSPRISTSTCRASCSAITPPLHDASVVAHLVDIPECPGAGVRTHGLMLAGLQLHAGGVEDDRAAILGVGRDPVVRVLVQPRLL